MNALMIRCGNRFSSYLLVLLCLGTIEGCATYRVYQVGGTEERELGNQPMTEWESRTLNTFLWGAVRQDLPVDNCALIDGTRTGIEEIKVEMNLGHRLATIFTLGIWQPVKISWRCAKPEGIRDTLD